MLGYFLKLWELKIFFLEGSEYSEEDRCINSMHMLFGDKGKEGFSFCSLTCKSFFF